MWLIAVTPTRLPFAIRSTIRRAPEPGLAGARRPLDDEGALVERARQPPRLREVRRLDRRAGDPPENRGGSLREHVLQRAETAAAVAHGRGEPQERAALRLRVDRPSGRQRPRQRLVARSFARRMTTSRAVVVDRADVHALAGRRIDPRARLDLVVLPGKRRSYS